MRVLPIALAVSVACTRSAPPAPVRGVEAGIRYLIDAQGSDGSWRSENYPGLKDGASLTPLVTLALLAARRWDAARIDPALREAGAFLASYAGTNGQIDPGERGLSYPVYSAGLTTRVLSDPFFAEHAEARDAWATLLRSHQLTGYLGWSESDEEYGGWGFASALPRKPKPGALAPGLIESNLSATVFALTGLRAAGARDGDPAFGPAATFLARAQNFEADPKARDPKLDDGGFFFIAGDPVRNKAGPAAAEERFRSYGSATADGLRAWLATGRAVTDPAVAAARDWLHRNFDPEHVPGDYHPSREPNRDAVYYYYAWSVAEALSAQPPATPWRGPLKKSLLGRQGPNGAWSNPDVFVREDDPLVATPFAVWALALVSHAPSDLR